MISEFHFLRPLWFLAFVPVMFIVWMIRRQQNASRPWQGIIAPHLLPHLLSGKTESSRFGPLQLLALGWAVAIVAIAGPTWKHEPAPFADDIAALAIVVKVSPTMMTGDVQPSRLGRSIQNPISK